MPLLALHYLIGGIKLNELKIKKMKLENLKQGDKIYDIDHRQVKHYTYLCVHPTGTGKYHILIDSCEEPFRIYGEKLQNILDQGFNSYQQVKVALADRLEESAKRLRKEEPSL